ncbi:insulinase family protein [Mucilaginibacter robiniae]|uniref:Insulinase family protein n=1 Tax=Mucilaginibacter robiniae TaxID=2728022 RepID=A0A7L5E317_9SPHI|nr:pitrilysin family protein [Mucilaginibacter robiniae]QJD97411.1 insulinase family protein [Mucilaginibacter robiniae]
MLKPKLFWCALAGSLFCQSLKAQKVDFTEYDLPNGLHVILHQDKSAPVVAVSVMYHVGSKNEVPGRTGFAHFFEHLLFEGTDNIKRGEFMKIVAANGGQNNANTTYDRTFYYEVFPSNQFKLGLWLESERMMHPVINEIGVKTQNEVVKEEKRLRMDNTPYGNLVNSIFKDLFPKHPYGGSVIGSMADLDAAKLDEFKAFFKKYYTPNNAALSIAGDIDVAQAKKLINDYFADIPKGAPVVYTKIEEAPITKQMVDTAYDANIQLPMITSTYRVPGNDSKDSKTLEMISAYLSNGGSSKLYKKMVDDKKEALQVGSFNYALEDYGAYITYALPNNNTPLNTLLADADAEIVKLQTNLISEDDYRKLQNQFENNYITANSKDLGVAENLANGYVFHHKNTNYTNQELERIRSISREDIRAAAIKYLQPSSRLVLYYLPVKKTT